MELDREGDFRIEITSYGLYEAESGAVAVNVEANVLEIWDGESQTWVDWRTYGVTVGGAVWVIKKGGGINEKSAESLMRAAGWNGRITSILDESWNPRPCQASCKRDEYQGQVRYKIAFLNAYDRTPGGMSNVTPEKAKELEGRFGGQFKAMYATLARQEAAPAGSAPPPPPAPPGVDPHKQAKAAAQQKENGEEIPF